MNTFDNGFTFKQISQGIYDIWSRGLNFPISGDYIIIRNIESDIFSLDFSDLKNSFVVDWELIEFSFLLCLELCKASVDSVSYFVKVLFALSFKKVPGKLGIKIGHKTFDLNLERISIIIDCKYLDNGYLLMLFWS